MIALLLTIACGTDAWSVKTLRDPGAARALAPAPVTSTVAALGALPGTARRRAYVVVGTVTKIKTEADSDLHVILADGAATMIVEFPLPGCAQGSLAYAAIVRARRQAIALRVGMRVRVTGMLFMDKPHGQSGTAPNAAELHPVFRVERLP
jgi:hypothetical protein